MAKIVSDLIFDIGLYDGDDTAYYLHQGYRVVAVDANPYMIEGGKQRFAAEIKAGRLTLVNHAISTSGGEVVRFHVSDVPSWSSVHEAAASRNGTGFKAVEVSTVRIDRLFEEHGVPYYLKVDIEGNDRLVLAGLSREFQPKYVSAESECQGDKAVLTEEESIENLELLHKAGYTRFKMIRQGDFSAVRATKLGKFLQRLANSATHGRMKNTPVISALGAPFSDRAVVEKIGYDFFKNDSGSGPWGEQLPGRWMDYATARRVYLEGRRAYFAQPVTPDAFSYWFDWHATY